MKVFLQPALNDANVDATQTNSQRVSDFNVGDRSRRINRNVPLNLCLILDHSGSMNGRPLETVKA